MPKNEMLSAQELPHSLMLDGRERLSVTGVEDVSSFDEQSVIALTSRGMLTISGDGLHIERLSLDLGELVVEGEVSALEYAEPSADRRGLLRRLFG